MSRARCLPNSQGDCGRCAQVDSDELQKWHVFCQGYVPSDCGVVNCPCTGPDCDR